MRGVRFGRKPYTEQDKKELRLDGLKLTTDFVEGTCLFVGIFSDRPLTRDELEKMTNGWKATKADLKGIHSFQRGTWIIYTLQVVLVAKD